jgi:superfamily II DNA or RNA helicase
MALKFSLSEDRKWLRLDHYDDILEFRQVQISFTRKVKNHWLYKKKGWTGEIAFLYKDKFLPAGLWGELIRMGKEHHIHIEIDGLEKLFFDIGFEEFNSWVTEFFTGSDKPPRDYQIDAAYKIIRYRLSTQELATNAGKTLIVYMVVAYMMSKGLAQKFLMVVPNTNLILQAVEDFQDYESHRMNKIGIRTQMVYGGSDDKLKEGANMVIGTFQSLVKSSPEFLSQFTVVMVDEAHFTNCVSIKKILTASTNAEWRYGLSGTLGDPSVADYYTIQQFLGPIVKKITPDFLFQNDYATPLDIRVIRMNYLPEEARKKLIELKQQMKETDPTHVYNLERKLVVRDRNRLNFICKFIVKASKNSLVLFQSVQDQYGMAIYNRLKEMTSDKEIFYVDGDISTDLREEYKERMKTGTNRILIASFKTFSTGISINNLHNIFFVESYKSEVIIKQSIGRMMRKHEDKEVAIVVDFVDDFSYKSKLNYLMKHSNERIEIYKREKFKYKIFDVNIDMEFDG